MIRTYSIILAILIFTSNTISFSNVSKKHYNIISTSYANIGESHKVYNERFPYYWIASKAIDWILAWVAGKGLDYIAGRYDFAEFLNTTSNHLDEIKNIREIDREEKRSIKKLGNICDKLSDRLKDDNKRIVDIRSNFINEFENLYREMSDLDDNIRKINEKIYRIEKEQKKQYRLIVNSRAEIRELEKKIVNMKGDVEVLKEDVEKLERAVSRDAGAEEDSKSQQAEQVQRERREYRQRYIDMSALERFRDASPITLVAMKGETSFEQQLVRRMRRRGIDARTGILKTAAFRSQTVSQGLTSGDDEMLRQLGLAQLSGRLVWCQLSFDEPVDTGELLKTRARLSVSVVPFNGGRVTRRNLNARGADFDAVGAREQARGRVMDDLLELPLLTN